MGLFLLLLLCVSPFEHRAEIIGGADEGFQRQFLLVLSLFICFDVVSLLKAVIIGVADEGFQRQTKSSAHQWLSVLMRINYNNLD